MKQKAMKLLLGVSVVVCLTVGAMFTVNADVGAEGIPIVPAHDYPEDIWPE